MPSRVLNSSDEYDQTVGQNQGLGQIFRHQAQKLPEIVAVVDGEITLTYGQLDAWATSLAWQLLKQSLRREEPVGVVVQHGLADVVAQLAIVYAGGTCAPMDPTLPDQQIQDRLDRLGGRCILTDQVNRHRDLRFHVVCLDKFSITEASDDLGDSFPVVADLEHCTHLIHTSGTTAEPKAVRIAARSILHVVFHAPFEPIDACDVVAHVNNSSFDVSLFDLWAPLLRGARIAVLSKDALVDTPVMAREIDRLGITVMATTTALLNLAAITYPKAFEKLRICFIGGEVANLPAIKTILEEGPPDILINAYGPTECCIFCMAHQITLEDIKAGSVSIGKPVGRGVAYIADDNGQAASEGELWIGGPGVSPGYVNQAEKNTTAFPMVSGVSTAPGDTVRMYRTGDIVRRRPDGQIDYMSRRDHQVKIRGFRVELGAVEAALLETGMVAEVVAMKMEIPQKGAGSVLVAYAVLTDKYKHSTADEVAKSVRTILPEYMVPQLELIPQMPLNTHAKVDRRRLKEVYDQRWEKMYSPRPEKPNQDIRATLSSLWSTLLGLPVSVFEDHEDFIYLGGTSLQASLLISHIRRVFGIEISLLTLYDNSTIKALTTVITQRLNGQLETLHDQREAMIADSKTANDLVLPSDEVIDWTRDDEGRIFITGATGFVGAFLLADLLSLAHVQQVGCLVRATSTVNGVSRIKAAMVKYGIWQERFAKKLVAFPGLLEDEYLGLGQSQFEEVANWASVIFHLGARVNYTQPYSLHRSANTLGTRNIVRLACFGRLKQMHYVSSISCFGPTGFVNGATNVQEDEPLLAHLNALPYDHGYAQSQWVADELLRRLMDRGFPVAVYRPGFITGHSQTGACNPDDFFSRLIDACCEIGCYPRLPNQRKEFVPVDYVNAIITHIAVKPTSVGRAYHIVPPNRDVNIDMDDTMDLVGEAKSLPIQGVSYAQWVEKLTESSPRRLLPLQPMLVEKVQDGKSRWELYENMPVYDATNTMEALADYPGGLDFPVLDPALMKRYLTYLQAGC